MGVSNTNPYGARDQAFDAFAVGFVNASQREAARAAFNAGWSARKNAEYRKALGLDQQRGLTSLEMLATEIAIVAPEEQNKWSRTARVPWVFIHTIRNKLAELGYDWRDGRASFLKAKAEGK